MSRPASIRNRLAGLAPLVAILASVALLSFDASAIAGIGNPLKKAKEKLQKAAEKKAGVESPEDGAGEPVVFDDVVLELTDARLEKILATFRKAAAASAGRPALVEKRGKLVEERGQIWEKYDDTIMKLQRKRGDIETCQHDGFNEAQERRAREYSQRALTDPALLEKFKNLAAQNNAAAAQGDSAAQARINAGMMAEILPTSEDSAAVRKKCGPIPARTAQENRMDAIDKEVASIDDQLRRIDEKVAEAQSKEGGLDRDQWAMAIERIQMYLSSVPSSSGGGSGGDNGPGSGGGSGSGGGGASANSPRGFSEEELKALEGRISELRRALGW
jgi:hypothetical protein